MAKDKNKYGQYFTIESVADFMVQMIKHQKSAKVLEPSCGKGVFIDKLLDAGFSDISAYEIDKTIDNPYSFVKYESFISAPITKCDVVIGNPPYIRWKNLEPELKNELLLSPLWNKYFNSLCDYLFIFILKSIEHLKDGGELIFICTEYWLNTTHSQSLRDYIIRNGYFSEIYHFKEASLFEGVNASFIVFRYIKSQNRSKDISLYHYKNTSSPTKEELVSLSAFIKEEIPQFLEGNRWLLASKQRQQDLLDFEDRCRVVSSDLFCSKELKRIGDVCDIGNGMVSGLDKAFNVTNMKLNKKESLEVINVLKAKDLGYYTFESESKYFFIQRGITEEQLKFDYPNIWKYIFPFKEELNERYNYGKGTNYWEFVFPRNYKLFARQEDRILVPCKERVSKKTYFRFVLAPSDYYPLQDVTGIFKKKNCRESIEYLVAYLNNNRVFDWLNFNGIVKGYIVEFSEDPIARIPYRSIDWEDSFEVRAHCEITSLVREYISTRNIKHIYKINNLFNLLFK